MIVSSCHEEKTGLAAVFLSKFFVRWPAGKDGFHLLRRLFRWLGYAGYLLCCILAFCLYPLVRHLPPYKGLWLFAERGNDAQDNAFHLFQFVRKTAPYLSAAYLIDRKSPDFVRVARLGRTIQPGSFSHYLAFVCADVKISTHIMGYSPNPYLFTKLKFDRMLPGKKVFLQHGILYNSISSLSAERIHVDLFVCSVPKEYHELLTLYHHPKRVVQPLGLCRYDRLFQAHSEKRQILVMPTWRLFLRNCSNRTFQDSGYFQSFHCLLCHRKLHALLEQYDYELVFQLHPEMQHFTPCFTNSHPRIHIPTAPPGTQSLLMESKLLITDYSSVFFDFSYLKKPLIYFQFDSEDFFSAQYRPGYFEFEKDGFGPVCRKVDEVLNALQTYLAGNMQLPSLYKKRVDTFFPPPRTDHCAQTFSAIQDLLSDSGK